MSERSELSVREDMQHYYEYQTVGLADEWDFSDVYVNPQDESETVTPR